ncbi:MAG TPA: type II toxin-antitoxin system RelE/ParE family toxin [Flavobacteriaceae bacterium]|nr:type II toxin-antitoxin system RelE/ParE family toxin [Flavobacteriaceae bacterium]
MAKYHLTNRATSDLLDIWDYTVETWSKKQAEKYYNQLIGTCKQIAENPEIGKEYFEVKKELLGLKTGRHIIFYEKLSLNEIRVIRILHERMDLENRIGD